MTGLQWSMQKSFSQRIVHTYIVTAVKVVVGIQLFQDCSWRRKKAPENPHMTARHKFRLSVNVDEFDSLQGSSDPSNATGTNSSVVMRANLRQNIAPYADMLG